MAQALGALFGLLIGSFLNVCIWRMPRDQSIAWPASHCTACQKPLKWFDNIPVFSYAVLRGKCRACGVRIPARYPVVEILGAAAGYAAFANWSGAYAVAAAVILWALIVITWIDWEHLIIPDELSVGGVVAGLIFSVCFPVWVSGEGDPNRWMALARSAFGIFIGGGFLYLMAIIGEVIFKKEAMGGGDVKMLAAIGAFFGWQGAVFALFIGSVAGSFVGLGVKWILKKEEIPFGPYLALGLFIYMFWGKAILSWYLAPMLQY